MRLAFVRVSVTECHLIGVTLVTRLGHVPFAPIEVRSRILGMDSRSIVVSSPARRIVRMQRSVRHAGH